MIECHIHPFRREQPLGPLGPLNNAYAVRLKQLLGPERYVTFQANAQALLDRVDQAQQAYKQDVASEQRKEAQSLQQQAQLIADAARQEKIERLFQPAIAFKQTREYGQAAKTLQKLLFIDPKNERARVMMGSMKDMVAMIPGLAGAPQAADIDDRQFGHMEALICSMTPDERVHPELVQSSRKRRIAAGAGRPPEEVNLLLKQFRQMRKMFSRAGRFGGMEKLMGAMPSPEAVAEGGGDAPGGFLPQDLFARKSKHGRGARKPKKKKRKKRR